MAPRLQIKSFSYIIFGIKAFLSVVYGGGLAYNGHVTSGSQRDGLTDNFIAKYFNIFFLQAKSVIYFLTVPVYQLYDDVYVLRRFNGSGSIKLVYVKYADSSQLYKISYELRTSSH